MMILRILLACFSVLLCFDCANAGYRGATILCVCSTTQCLEHNMRHCNTTGMCFSQYLDRHDGSQPVVRGCISSKTPLLCENRRPAIAKGPWPVLLCCNSNLCNRDAVPTTPSWFLREDSEEDTADTHGDDIPNWQGLPMHPPGHQQQRQHQHQELTHSSTSSELDDSLSSSVPQSSLKAKSSSSLPHIVSPVYITVLVLGVISLIIIGIVAAFVLKRNNRFYIEQYGALEHQQEDYLKQYRTPIQIHCDCDSELESLSQCSQQYVHVVYANEETNNT